MPSISFKKKDLPFLLGGGAELTVDAGDLRPNRPLDERSSPVWDARVTGGGGAQGTLGQVGTVKVTLSTAANVSLTPIFATSRGARARPLAAYGSEGFFKGGANADKVVLAFEAGASVGASGVGSFRYAPLKAGLEVDAGAEAGYAYLRAIDKATPVRDLFASYFRTMRLPEQAGARTLEPGEAISLRYGGYLKLGAEVSAGYALSGSKSFTLGALALSEKVDLSVVGRIGLKADVAGQFSILMTAASELPGWTLVKVRRHQAKSLAIAADVNVGFKNRLDLPSTADEFLGAVLGVNAANFLNVLDKARELSDFEEFKEATDGLARRFVSELIGKGFDRLSSETEFTDFLNRVSRVVTSYQGVEARAVALFDRYFDRADVLTNFLEQLASLEASGLATLRSQLNPELWNILAQLTDGDPIGFLLPEVTIAGEKVNSAAELSQRASAVLELIRADAHKEIREVIALAKSSFDIDVLFRELAKIDTVDELEAVANERVGEFVSRLVGRTLDSSTNLKAALAEIHAVLEKLDGFKDKLFKTFKAAASSSYQFALHAQYSRASERDALVEVLIRPGHPRGPELLRQAGQGDFEEILTTSDTDLVRLQDGLFTHKTMRERVFNVNIVGWHVNWRYCGFDRVITETEQRLVPSKDGVTVRTTAELEVERRRRRQDEELHVNFLLRAMGESAKVVASDARNASFFIDTLTSLSATYKLGLTDDDTSAVELRDYLGFADELGLAAKGATLEALDPLLERAPNGGFGRVEAAYEIRFGAKALSALLSIKSLTTASERAVRTAMRRILLSNYLKSDSMHDVAFAYATPGVFDVFSREGFAKFTNTSERRFNVSIGTAAIAAPVVVDLSRMEREVLVTLYNIENSMVKAIRSVFALIHSGRRMDPGTFEKRLSEFGRVLTLFDKFDQTTSTGGIGANSIFAVFDALVRLAAKGESANITVLRMSSDAGGHAVEKLFMTAAAADE